MRFFRFLIVGSLNTAFNYGVYALFVYAGAGHVVAATISFCVGLVTSFSSQGRLVFQHRGRRGFVPFVLSWLLIYVAYVAVLDRLVRAGVDEYLAGAILLPGVVVLSFLVLRFVVFRDRSTAPRP